MASCVMMSQDALKKVISGGDYSEASAAALIKTLYIPPTIWFLSSDFEQCFVCLKCLDCLAIHSPKNLLPLSLQGIFLGWKTI